MEIRSPPAVWGSKSRVADVVGNAGVVFDEALGEIAVVLQASGNVSGANAFECASQERNLAGEDSEVTFEASAISRAWPMRPKPVTSVME